MSAALSLSTADTELTSFILGNFCILVYFQDGACVLRGHDAAV
jgi:hypothetical protein